MPKFHLLESMRYLSSTMLRRREIRAHRRPDIAPSPSPKEYPATQAIALPRDWTLKEARLTPLLQKRRSRRTFGDEPISLSDLAYMLWATQGVTAQAGRHLLRTSPSAGALYPIETYIAVHNVEGLADGLYHFKVAEF